MKLRIVSRLALPGLVCLALSGMLTIAAEPVIETGFSPQSRWEMGTTWRSSY